MLGLWVLFYFILYLFNLYYINKKIKTEYERKVEVACNVAFKNEEKDVQTMQDINKLLIDNILPSSVAAKFLSPSRDTDVSFFSLFNLKFNFKQLYSRDHEHVCVMFASIPNFKDYWSECDKTRKLECLRLLNEIVCEFDKV